MSQSTQPPDQKPPSKAQLLNQLLDEGMTMIHLDARVDGVDVPDVFRNDTHLRLNLSWRFGRTMTVDDDKVIAELTFGGHPHLCVIPFSAVFGMVSHATNRTLMWPEDIPPEVLQELEKPTPPPRPSPSGKKGNGPRLVAVKNDPDDETPAISDVPPVDTPAASDVPPDEPQPPTPPRRGHLRLVK